LKRKLIDKLLEWKESSDQMPILLTGGRGVGKTYLVYDFANSFYKESVYINFESEPFLYDLLFNNNPSTVECALKDYFHLSEYSEPVLVILDEITRCPDIERVINFLGQSELPYHIIAISSSQVIKYKADSRFYKLKLFPLDFEEFLVATGNEWYIEVITVHYKTNMKIPDIVHQELLTLFELYLKVGGMPLAVNEYNNTGADFNVSDQHRLILNSFIAESYKGNSEGDFLKISQMLGTIDKQLMKENRKFQYKLIRKGATQALYSDALQYIKNNDYGMCCYKIPEADHNHLNFKLYLLDTGLLQSIIKNQGIQINEQYRKGLLENYVAQGLAANGYPLYFWESDSQAKLDFIICRDSTMIPVEVRANDNTRSRNVSIFQRKFDNVTDSIKISTKNFEYANNVKYVPIYAVFCI
jgi:predicted AAA+ superfamily ATPase